MENVEESTEIVVEPVGYTDFEPTKIHESPKRKVIPVPELPFEKFSGIDRLNNPFETVGDILETKEWEEIYSNYYEFDEMQKEIRINETMAELEEYTIEQQMEEFRKCAENFAYFCTKFVKIAHPIFGPINFFPYIYQKRVIEFYGHHRFNILSKFRQAGLTTVSVIWATWRCLFKSGQRIMVVSKTDREAISAGEVVKTCVDGLPSWLRPETDKFNEHEKQFKDTNSVLWSHTVEAARGKAITILIIDEAAFVKDMEKHWKALYPVISTGGSCEVISTVNGMGNWYQHTYYEAVDAKNPFNVIELDYWEHPLYNDPKWIEDTRANLGEKGWQQEVERSFLDSGNTWMKGSVIIDLVDATKESIPVRMLFDKWKNAGGERRNEWDQGALWIWREPIDGREYILAADCAEGVGDVGDNNGFHIFDALTLDQVAEFCSNTVPPHIYAGIINEIGYYYNTALVVIENVNHGVAVLTLLENDMGYPNLYSDEKSLGIKPNKMIRQLCLQSLQQKLMTKTVGIRSKRFAQELNTFVVNPRTKKAEAQSGKHDDLIISAAMGLYVRDLQSRDMPTIGPAGIKELVQKFKTDQFEEIRREIVNGSEDDWLNTIIRQNERETSIDEMFTNSDMFKRKADKLLKEFGF